CTFAKAPRDLGAPYLSEDEAIAIAEAGARAGCHEALFTLGDQPERRYRVARAALAALGHDSTISYLAQVARRVHEATGLLPHVNPGVMSLADLELLRPVSVSAGLMLESVAERLCARGGPHHGCPDKQPRVRLETIAAAGEMAVPFTTGILIGIGETRRERIESLLALRALHARYGHLQEIIVQNFRAKPGTAMANAPEPSLAEHLWTIAVARLVFAPDMTIQAPPNLNSAALDRLLVAGIDDWGGVSPVTPDHVNPEAPWPQPALLRPATEAAGTARADAWTAGGPAPPQLAAAAPCALPRRDELRRILHRARAGRELDEAEGVRLFAARGREVAIVCRAADELRAEVNGARV